MTSIRFDTDRIDSLQSTIRVEPGSVVYLLKKAQQLF